MFECRIPAKRTAFGRINLYRAADVLGSGFSLTAAHEDAAKVWKPRDPPRGFAPNLLNNGEASLFPRIPYYLKESETQGNIRLYKIRHGGKPDAARPCATLSFPYSPGGIPCHAAISPSYQWFYS